MSVLSMLTSLAQATYTTTSTVSDEEAAALGAGIVVFLLFFYAAIFIFAVLPSIITAWSLFKKAGKPGWASIIPVYNNIIMLEIAEKPIWWIALLLIPGVNFVIGIMILIELTKKYDKPATIITWVLVPIVSVFLVKNTHYIGGNTAAAVNAPSVTPPTAPTPPTTPTLQ